VEVTLLDRCNYHLPQPLLYEVATGALSPANVAAPLRRVLRHQKNTRVLLAEAIDIEVANRSVVLSDGKVGYDTLIVATGARHHYFGKDQWEELAPGLKTIEDATHIRRRILLAFEAAERESAPEKIRAWLTFVIVGAGATGVELAGALGEIANDTLKNDFRRIKTSDARIPLVEGANRVLPHFPPRLSQRARSMLVRLGVTVRTGALVPDITAEAVTLREGSLVETISTGTVLWAAGVAASPLGGILANKTGAGLDPSGRVVVGPDLSLPGHPEIFVIGDLAHFSHRADEPLPGIAQPAMQEGPLRRQSHQAPAQERGPFHYFDLGNMATIGRAAAVADLHWVRLSGLPAWLVWLFVHLMYIVEFQTRLLVFLQLAWNYCTFNRSARLITGKNPLPLDL
jgi:NADH:ubiquinone reductase (H+-translocating)